MVVGDHSVMDIEMASGQRRIIQVGDYMSSNFSYQRRRMKQRVKELAS